MHQQRDELVVVSNASFYMLQLQQLMHQYATNWWLALSFFGLFDLIFVLDFTMRL